MILYKGYRIQTISPFKKTLYERSLCISPKPNLILLPLLNTIFQPHKPFCFLNIFKFIPAIRPHNTVASVRKSIHLGLPPHQLGHSINIIFSKRPFLLTQSKEATQSLYYFTLMFCTC